MNRRAVVICLTVAAGASVTLLRFLATRGYSDDHYIHLAGAQQILFGGWPSRDYVDFGAPLQYVASAAMMALFGESLFTEALFVASMFGLAAALTLKAAVDLTGSVSVALVAVAVEVAAFPRSYGYPKMLLYVVGLLAMWRYAARPTYGRMLQLALVVVAAFLMRHDHGLTLGLGGAVAVVLAPGSLRERSVRLAAYAGIGFALVLPYLVYLSIYGGLSEHVAGGLVMSELEQSRTALTLPGFTLGSWAGNAVPLLFYAVYALPLLALVLAPHDRRGWIAPLAVVGMLANWFMVRDELSVRLPDAILPAALLLAWFSAWLWRAGRGRLAVPARATTIGLIAIVMAATVHVGETREQLDRAGFYGGLDRLPERVAERTAALKARLSETQVPSASAAALLPFFAYADRCLGPGDRVLVADFLPEVAVLARQPFAGGQIVFRAGMLARPRDHQLVMARLARERVPVAVFRPERFADVAAEFPELARYVERFTRAETIAVPDRIPISIRFDPLYMRRHDAETGWPCYQ